MNSASYFLLILLAAPRPDASDRFFADLGPLPVFRVELAKDQMEKLRAEPRKYVSCTVRVGEEVYRDVGIHIKGAAGSFRPLDDKPALTLDFGKFKNKQHFHDIDRLHLNNSVQDPRYMTEILAGRMMLKAGIPTARGTHGLVELNGKKLGLYVVKEGYHTAFLRRHFHSSSGNLYDGGFLQDIDTELKHSHGGDAVPDYADLRAAAAASRESDLHLRYAKLERRVDLNRFFNMMAIEVLTWHWDGYAIKKNNYRVYHDPLSDKLVFIPHGMDQLWWEPHAPVQPPFQGLIARKLILTEPGRERYQQALREMVIKVHNSGVLHRQVDEMLRRFHEHLRPMHQELYDDILHNAKELKRDIQAREDFLRKQLKL